MDYVNSVRLVGRVTARGEPRELPSGDTVVTLRVVVPRVGRRAGPARGDHTARSESGHATVDTIDVACWTAVSRRTAARCEVDDHVEVDGSLRRRFFRAGGSVASRYEVEASRLRRRPAPRG